MNTMDLADMYRSSGTSDIIIRYKYKAVLGDHCLPSPML